MDIGKQYSRNYMKKEFSNVFKIAPPLIKDGVYYYDSQDAGDQFSLEEVVDT